MFRLLVLLAGFAATIKRSSLMYNPNETLSNKKVQDQARKSFSVPLEDVLSLRPPTNDKRESLSCSGAYLSSKCGLTLG